MSMKKFYANLGLLFVALTWGLNPPVMKVGLLDMPPFTYNALRILIAAISAGVLLYFSGTYKKFEPSDLRKLLKYSLIGYCGFQLLLIIGLRFTNSTNSALIFSLLPLSVAIINRVCKNEKVAKSFIIGVTLSLIGVILIISNSGLGFTPNNLGVLGDLILLIGQGFYAYYTVFSKELQHKYSLFQISFFVILANSVLFLLLAIPELVQHSLRQVTTAAFLSALFSGVLPVCLGNFFWIWGTTIIGSTKVSAYSNLTPIFAAIGGYLFLDEKITILQVVGGLIIIGGFSLALGKTKDEGDLSS
ncbi:MAG: DMT family transporter [Peptococcia bacterium]